MNPLQALIDQEVAKLNVLKSEVSIREARIATLKSLLHESSTELDALLSGKALTGAENVSADRSVLLTTPDAEQNEGVGASRYTRRVQRKRGELRTSILQVLADRGQKKLSEIYSLLEQAGVEVTADRLRNELWKMRIAGVVESPGNGIFHLPQGGNPEEDPEL